MQKGAIIKLKEEEIVCSLRPQRSTVSKHWESLAWIYGTTVNRSRLLLSLQNNILRAGLKVFVSSPNDREPCFAIAQFNNHLNFKLQNAEILPLLFSFGRVLTRLWIPIYRLRAHSSIRMDYINFVNAKQNTSEIAF